MKVVCAYFGKGQNIGDEVSSPSLYFPLGPRFDIEDAPEADATIYGGGSMCERALKHMAGRNGIKIGWGVGYTVRDMLRPHSPLDYAAFDLIGVRDWGHGRWVPCASCMSPLFDLEYQITRKVVFYGHKLLAPMGEMNNDHMDFGEVLSYLGSGRTIVTSSYHGAYWGTLLGRKVVAIPYGSKFYTLKHVPTIVGEYNEQEGTAYPGALHDCREANLQMWREVHALLGSTR